MASSADGLFEDDKNVDSSRLKLPEGVVFSPQKVVTGEENEKTVYMTVSRAFRRRDGQVHLLTCSLGTPHARPLHSTGAGVPLSSTTLSKPI